MDLPQKIEWTLYGLLGSGITLGVRLSRGEKVNEWAVVTTVITGMAVAGTATEGLVNFFHLEPFWAGFIALLLGIMAMGFVINALDGKIQYINKLMRGGSSDAHDDKS